MSARATSTAWDFIQAGRARGAAALVLLKLADRADVGGECWPGQERTARDCKLTDRSVRNALSELQEANLIEVTPRFDMRGGRTSSLYRIRIDPPENYSGGVKNNTPAPQENSSRPLRNILPPPQENSSGTPRKFLPGNLKQESKKEPPPGEAGSSAPAGGGGGELEKIVREAHLCPRAVAKFETFATRLNGVERDSLIHELKSRLPAARDKTALAIKLAELAAAGQLDDSTAPQRAAKAFIAAQRLAQQHAEAAVMQANALERARRAREGPSETEAKARKNLADLAAKMKRGVTK